MPGNLESNAREHGLRNGNRKSGFGILQVVKRIVFFLGSDCNTASNSRGTRRDKNPRAHYGMGSGFGGQ